MALEQLIEARGGELAGAELREQLRRDRVDVTLPGAPPQPIGRLHVLTATMRELEDVFLGLGFTAMEGPEVETVHYNFDALNHSPTHPARARTDTFYIDTPPGAEELVLRTHTSPMQVRAMEAHPPPLYVVIPGRVYRPDSDATHTPQFHQIEGLAVDEDITLADLKGTLLVFARELFGEAREVRLRPHFFPFTEPSVEVDVSCFHCSGKGFLRDGARCYLCKGEGWLEVLGAGEVDPNVYSHVPTTAANAPGYTPRRCRASRGGWAWSGSRCSSTASPICGCTSKTICASWSSSNACGHIALPTWNRLAHAPTGGAAHARPRGGPHAALPQSNRERGSEMRVPLPWLREYCDPDMDVQAIEQRLTMTGTKVEAIHHHGVPSAENFVLGRVLSAEQHPDADRLRVCSVELGLSDGPATIVCGAPNVAAGQTVAVGRPGAVMPDGTKLGKVKLRGVVSEGMILAESELDIDSSPIDLSPPTQKGIMVLDGELAPGTPLQKALAIRRRCWSSRSPPTAPIA